MTDTPIIDHDSLQEEIKKNNVRIIDVRRDEDYQHGHITNSVNLPLAKLLNDDSPESIAKIAGDLGISDDTPVVAVSYTHLRAHET